MKFRILELCKQKGITQKELAGLLGVSVPELFAPQPTNTITCPKCGAVLEVKERG